VAEPHIGACVRPVEERDLEHISRIYAHYVAHTYLTFDLDAPSEAEWRARWHAARDDGRPWLVSTGEETVWGYATASAFRPKAAYRSTVETTVYLDPGATGRRLGRQLYEALLVEATARSFHLATAGIALPNDASVALHEGLGFTPVGTFCEVGHKLGQWRDVQWWQRALTPGQGAGCPVRAG